MPLVLAQRRQRQEDLCKFEATLSERVPRQATKLHRDTLSQQKEINKINEKVNDFYTSHSI